MDKRELKNRIQDSFLDLAPDVYEQIMNVPIPDSVLEKQVEQKHGFGRNVHWSNWFVKRMTPAITCLALVCLCYFGVEWKERDNVYVMLDINPSVCMVLNDSYEIKSIKGLNTDGKEFVEKLEWTKGQSMESVVKEVTAHLYEGGYLQEDRSILIRISSGNNEQYESLKKQIREEMQQQIKEQELSEVEVAFLQGDNGEKEPGREVLMEKLVKERGISQKECENMSVGELIDCYSKYNAHKMEIEQVSATEEIVEEKEGVFDDSKRQRDSEQKDSEAAKEKVLETEQVDEKEKRNREASENVNGQKRKEKTEGNSKKRENSTKKRENESRNEKSVKNKTTDSQDENSMKEKTRNSSNENSMKEKTKNSSNENSMKEKTRNSSNENFINEKTTSSPNKNSTKKKIYNRHSPY